MDVTTSSKINCELVITTNFKDRSGSNRISGTIGSAGMPTGYKENQRHRQSPQKKETAPLTQNLRIAYGSESLEGAFETSTIVANDSNLNGTGPGSPASPYLDPDASKRDNQIQKKLFISESLDKN